MSAIPQEVIDILSRVEIGTDSVAINHHGVTVRINGPSTPDGAIVVEVETTFEPDGSDGPGMRLWINDDPTYVGVPFTEQGWDWCVVTYNPDAIVARGPSRAEIVCTQQEWAKRWPDQEFFVEQLPDYEVAP